uniref:Uncharacterized protein n=1 Tax=Arundo donax TaxID=35708 RepID=A0A0A9GRI7_ARUDO
MMYKKLCLHSINAFVNNLAIIVLLGQPCPSLDRRRQLQSQSIVTEAIFVC